MKKSIEEKLMILKDFKQRLDENNTHEFDALIESIKKELSGSYKNRFFSLKFYELYEEQPFADDLPF